MTVYKIYAKHEDKMIEKFGRGYYPRYSKNGMLYYSKNVALKNLAKANEYKEESLKNKNLNQEVVKLIEFELKTYEMKEV